MDNVRDCVSRRVGLAVPRKSSVDDLVQNRGLGGDELRERLMEQDESFVLIGHQVLRARQSSEQRGKNAFRNELGQFTLWKVAS